jgi:hypothetical protein
VSADDDEPSDDDDSDSDTDTDTDTYTDSDSDRDRDTDAGGVRRAVGGPWGRMAEKWIPDSLREARVDPGRRGAVLLTVVAE